MSQNKYSVTKVPGLDGLSDMSFEQLQLLTQQTLALQIKKVVDMVEEIKDKQTKTEKKMDIIQDELSSKILQVEQLSKSNLRSSEPRFGNWMHLSTFGKQFNTVIGAKTMGKLLRVVGLAQRSKNTTEPYFDKVGKERYVMRTVYDGRACWLWNYKRCIEYIDMWLEREGYYTKFYDLVSLGNEQKLKEFIDHLHRVYCGR